MKFEALRSCTFSARLDCHFLLHAPALLDERAALVVALHGFGSDPETMLRLAAEAVGPGHVIASVQGPNQFFLGSKQEQVGYGWITSRNPASSIRLHHDMVLHVLDSAGREYGIAPSRRILVGFSQAVALNYRLAATCPEAARGVMGVCGGLPGDWELGAYKPVKAALLHIARRADQHYPPEVTAAYPERLQLRAGDVEFHQLEGGHRFPDDARPIVEKWMERIL